MKIYKSNKKYMQANKKLNSKKLERLKVKYINQ